MTRAGCAQMRIADGWLSLPALFTGTARGPRHHARGCTHPLQWWCVWQELPLLAVYLHVRQEGQAAGQYAVKGEGGGGLGW